MNLGITPREWLVLVCGFLFLRPYFEGATFITWIGPHALQWISKLADATDKLLQRRIQHMESEFEVVNRVRAKHRAANVLLRFLTNWKDYKDIDDEIPAKAFQNQYSKENRELTYSCHDCDNQTVNVASHKIMTGKPDNVELSTFPDFMIAKDKNAICDHKKRPVGTTNCLFTFNKKDHLVRQTSPDGSVQRLVPINLRPTILYLASHPTLAGSPGER